MNKPMIIFGPSLLGWMHVGEPTLELLAEIGFTFLMFLGVVASMSG